MSIASQPEGCQAPVRWFVMGEGRNSEKNHAGRARRNRRQSPQLQPGYNFISPHRDISHIFHQKAKKTHVVSCTWAATVKGRAWSYVCLQLKVRRAACACCLMCVYGEGIRSNLLLSRGVSFPARIKTVTPYDLFYQSAAKQQLCLQKACWANAITCMEGMGNPESQLPVLQ